MRRILLIYMMLAVGLTGYCQTPNTWTGNVNSQWGNAGNWSLGIVPGNCHEAVIPIVSGKPDPVLSSNISIGKITFSGGNLSMNNFSIALVLDLNCGSSCGCNDCDFTEFKESTNPTINESALGTSTYPYIIDNTHITADGSSVAQQITYLDGLGRIHYTINREAGGASIDNLGQLSDIIKVSWFDHYGRPYNNYLPFSAINNSGNYPGVYDLTSFYSSLGKSGNPITEIIYDTSPLNRVISQKIAGKAVAQTILYRTNTSADAIKLLTYAFASPNRIDVSSYAAGQLNVVETTDENGNKVTEYKDWRGQLVCRDVSGKRTSYCYDDYGQLRCVVPPNAASLLSSANFNPLTSDLTFSYGYDTRGRMVSKKIPSAGVTVMTYDLRDRMVTSTDGKSQVTTNVYDDLNRITTVKLGADDVIKNYYDTYPAANDPLESYDLVHGFSVSKLTDVRGLQTASESRNLLTGTMLRTTTYYDALGRTIQSVSKNHKNTFDRTSSKLDFSGRTTETKLTTRNNLVVQTRTSYDRAGRTKAICQRVSDGNTGSSEPGAYWEPVGRYSYNLIGEMTSKTLGCAIQKVDYTYNMQGWMTSINNPAQLSIGTEKDFFGMTLGYDPVGNITSWDYRVAQRTGSYADAYAITPKEPYSYTFAYDNLYRIKTANLNKNTSSVFALGGADDGKMGYDDSGNIMSLKRTFNGAVVDNLAYSYLSGTNKLGTITETGTNPSTPNEFFLSNASYNYDANGNLINDTGKGITNIDYNYLNLPKTVSKTGQTIGYNYSGDGSKLNATFASNKVYDYVSGLSYLNDNLEFIPTAEGRILPPGTAVNPQLNGNTAAPAGVTNGFYRYEYDIKDQLGNLRVACRCGEKSGAISSGDAYSPIVVQENHYDPWGLGLPLNADNEKVGGSPADRYTYNGKEKQQDVGWLDYGARMYDSQIGRWNMVDPTSSISFSQSPFQYVLNNPIKFIDPFGLWEVTSTGYSTTNPAEISRFMNYASFERNGLNNNPSYSQASGFIKGEMSGKGGTLSNGGKLISSIQETGYRTKAGDIWWDTDEQSVSDAWHSVQGDLTPDALDPRTVGHNLLYLAYAGGDNPQTYSHNYDYSYIPKNVPDFPAIGHDRRYDNLGIKGFPGLFGDTRTIGADWRFVAEEFAVLASSSSLFVKSQAFILGGGLGFLASFKTLGQSQVPGGYGQMYVWYQISNNGGVNNIPSKTKE